MNTRSPPDDREKAWNDFDCAEKKRQFACKKSQNNQTTTEAEVEYEDEENDDD